MRKGIETEVKERTGFNPCCERHMDYKPCDCPRWSVILNDEAGRQIVLTFETKEAAEGLKQAYRVSA